MKINRITILVCSGVIFFSGVAIIRVQDTMIQGILSGIFTGFIVSLVSSIIGYFHEREKILEKTDNNIRSLYINMNVICRIIGNTLPQIHKTSKLDSLPFKQICDLSELNIEFIEKMDLGLFNPILKKGNLAKIYLALMDFKLTLYNIKRIAGDTNSNVIDYTIKSLQLENTQLRGLQVSQQDIENVDALKNAINIRTAKFHEYVTAQTMELEKIAEAFYSRRGSRQSWAQIKVTLTAQVEDLIKR